MDESGLKIIREALDTQLRGEDFDRALGRTIRRRDMEFKKYLEVIGELRELAKANSVSIEEAAKRLFPRA